MYAYAPHPKVDTIVQVLGEHVGTEVQSMQEELESKLDVMYDEPVAIPLGGKLRHVQRNDLEKLLRAGHSVRRNIALMFGLNADGKDMSAWQFCAALEEYRGPRNTVTANTHELHDAFFCMVGSDTPYYIQMHDRNKLFNGYQDVMRRGFDTCKVRMRNFAGDAQSVQFTALQLQHITRVMHEIALGDHAFR